MDFMSKPEKKRWAKAVEITLTTMPKVFGFGQDSLLPDEEIKATAEWIYDLLGDPPRSSVSGRHRGFRCEECDVASISIDFGGGPEFCARHLPADWIEEVRRDLGPYWFARYFRSEARPEADAIILADIEEIRGYSNMWLPGRLDCFTEAGESQAS